jgi:hypothetical protein
MLKQDYIQVNASTPTLINYENYGTPYLRKMKVYIKNVNPSTNIYVGDANVTKNGGSWQIDKNGGTAEFELSNDDALYCITDSGSFQITAIKIIGE